SLRRGLSRPAWTHRPGFSAPDPRVGGDPARRSGGAAVSRILRHACGVAADSRWSDGRRARGVVAVELGGRAVVAARPVRARVAASCGNSRSVIRRRPGADAYCRCRGTGFDRRMVMVDALNLGRRLRVRSTAYVAGEPVPFFWPMRTFIHHNPLYGLEDMPFEQAVRRGAELFHARMFLPRSDYQRWQREGKVRPETLDEEIGRRSQDLPPVPGVDWPRWLHALMQTPH